MESAICDAIEGETDLSSIDLVVFHCTIGHDLDVLTQTASTLCPGAKVVGCTCAGVIGKEGANENLRALAVMAVSASAQQEIAVGVSTHLNGKSSFEEARKMALAIKEQQAGTNIVQLYATGIDVACDQLIAGIESAFGPELPILGGTASDNMRAERTFQFANGEVLEHGAVLVGYADPSLNLHAAVHHGFSPIGTGYTVTKSLHNQIFEIEGQAAWPFLMEKLGLPADQHPGPCIPIAGMGERLSADLQSAYHNEHILRVITKVDPSDGSFFFPSDCPEGTTIWFSERNEELIFQGLETMMADLVGQIGDEKIVAVYHTDCAARGRALFDKILKEEIIHRMQHPLFPTGVGPWLGMYGFGEFTPLAGKNLFHNYTTSIYALTRA